jgi:Domain of unknown function (DUF4397)
MKFARPARQIATLLAASALLAGPAAMSASASARPAAWIRMAHLSPDTPAIDVYLYSFGDPGARIVLRHIAYGTVSAYETVAEGDYSLAMRPAGASASSQPVVSGSVTVKGGQAYTAAAVGTQTALRLQVIGDDLTTPRGKALVRVVQASLKHRVVTVRWDGKTVASRLPFASATSYRPVSPGTEKVSASTGSGDAESTVTLTAGTVHTLVVLDGVRGLEIANLEDAAGSAHAPAGGARTGYGGTAPHGPGSPGPWLAVIGAGALLATTGGLGLRRSRLGRRLHPGA